MHGDCVTCFHKQAGKLFSRYQMDEAVSSDILVRLSAFVEKYNDDAFPAPLASCYMHRLLKRVTGDDDPYVAEKKQYNDLLLRLEPSIRSVINEATDPFQVALRYALAGNIIDFGAPHVFDVEQTLGEAANMPLAIDHSESLRNALHDARKVLYLGDNAGEIVLDKIFIETIASPDLIFSVRGSNIINDVTLNDARYVGLDKVARVIPNGYDAPSTILNRCSRSFRQIFDEADVIISKGQGNLEGLLQVNHKRIFFLLMVKCSVMSELVGVPVKSVVVFENRIVHL